MFKLACLLTIFRFYCIRLGKNITVNAVHPVCNFSYHFFSVSLVLTIIDGGFILAAVDTEFSRFVTLPFVREILKFVAVLFLKVFQFYVSVAIFN